ncbi:MAG TPA: EamA family transporter RarD [Opitutus sp.]|nr:EamA family transporter RarD [Opitutus sp.]
MPPSTHSSEAVRGALAASACYLLWGLVPVFWKQLAAVDATEVIAHRHVWSLLFVLVLMRAGAGWEQLREAVRARAPLQWHAASGVLLTVNWLVYVWGVNHGHVIETSLGYFLVPLVVVALGRVLLHERLRPGQWLAIACALVGVLVLVERVGRLPWIALTLAGTWSVYGLLRKKSPLGPLVGLGLETLLMTPPAVGFLLWRQYAGAGAFGHASLMTHVYLVSVGVITAVPLLLFAFAARRIRFSTLGFLQYIAPSLQFAIGLWFYHEPFSPQQAAAFVFIWCGLGLYTADNLWSQRRLLASGS